MVVVVDTHVWSIANCASPCLPYTRNEHALCATRARGASKSAACFALFDGTSFTTSREETDSFTTVTPSRRAKQTSIEGALCRCGSPCSHQFVRETSTNDPSCLIRFEPWRSHETFIGTLQSYDENHSINTFRISLPCLTKAAR